MLTSRVEISLPLLSQMDPDPQCHRTQALQSPSHQVAEHHIPSPSSLILTISRRVLAQKLVWTLATPTIQSTVEYPAQRDMSTTVHPHTSIFLPISSPLSDGVPKANCKHYQLHYVDFLI